MSSVQQNLENLRSEMQKTGFDAYIIYSTDPHMSEYVPDRWTGRAAFSGFNGSAGTLIVSLERAALWTDGRYFLQADQQLQGTGIELMRDGLADTPDYADFILDACGSNARVGMAADCVSLQLSRSQQSLLASKGIRLEATDDLLTRVWKERPGIPLEPLSEFPADTAGETRADRLQRLFTALKLEGADYLLISSLDDLAYLFLYRSSDIPFNPVSVGYALIQVDRNQVDRNQVDRNQDTASGNVRLYLPKEKHTSAAFLEAEGIELCDYNSIFNDLAAIPSDAGIMIDPARTNLASYLAFPKGIRLIQKQLPVVSMKARKNPVETANIRRAMQWDGAAMLRYLHWLKTHSDIESLNEFTAARKLQSLRAEHPEYRGDSFPAISGFGPNGAIVHYSVQAETAATFNRSGLYLIDSGAHYSCGTTDITRVVCWDQPSRGLQRDYTLVLKAHIALATARFPAGTRGIQLDAIARNCLWREGLDYRHGTGHGVGYYLPVHEGPQSISTRMTDVPITTGMLSSNEPGLYRAGEYGIRIENLILCVGADSRTASDFLCFETMSLCPFERDLILPELLSPDELQWVNAYHARVRNELLPMLGGADADFLERACKTIGEDQ